MEFYESHREPRPAGTTELDWREAARRDGWRLDAGSWVHEEHDLAYDDGSWVYYGNGVWEDAYIATLTPDQHRDAHDRYVAGMRSTIDNILCMEREKDDPSGRETPGGDTSGQA